MSLFSKVIPYLSCFAGLTMSAQAVVVAVPNPGVATEIGVRARNGLSNAELVMFDSLPTVTNVATRNATGSPVWTYGYSYPFKATWNAATGTLTYSVDFGKSGIAGDVTTGGLRETISHVYPEFIGTGFKNLSLMAQGRNSPAVNMSLTNLVFNGDSVGNLTSSGNAPVTAYYASSVTGEAFTAVTLTGELTLSGNGTTATRPQMEFRLGGPVAVSGAIPEPSVFVLGGIGAMAGLVLTRRRR